VFGIGRLGWLEEEGRACWCFGWERGRGLLHCCLMDWSFRWRVYWNRKERTVLSRNTFVHVPSEGRDGGSGLWIVRCLVPRYVLVERQNIILVYSTNRSICGVAQRSRQAVWKRGSRYVKFNIALHRYLVPQSSTAHRLCCAVPCKPAAPCLQYGHASRHIVYRCFPPAIGLFLHGSDARPPHRLDSRPAEATLHSGMPPTPRTLTKGRYSSRQNQPRSGTRTAPLPSLPPPPTPASAKHKLVEYNQRVDDDQGYCHSSARGSRRTSSSFRGARGGGTHTPHNHPHTGDQVDNLGLHAHVRTLPKGAIVRRRRETDCGVVVSLGVRWQLAAWGGVL
jgi:hypothetical protein